MTACLRRLRSDESGFTLVELLAAMSIGLVVLMGAFLLLDHATATSADVSYRQDATQRGRQAMESMTRDLRSVICFGNASGPIVSGNATGVAFTSDLTGNDNAVQKRELAYDAAAGTITERVYASGGAYPNFTFGSTPIGSRLLLSRVGKAIVSGQSQSVFRYFEFTPGGAQGDLRELPDANGENARRVVLVRITFFAKPDRVNPADRDATTFTSDVYIRIVDPTRPTEGPTCI
jgi:prepilin-type N-terminal cleavage/methylation domain-containing protein